MSDEPVERIEHPPIIVVDDTHPSYQASEEKHPPSPEISARIKEFFYKGRHQHITMVVSKQCPSIENSGCKN